MYLIFSPLEDIIMFFILGVQVYHRDISRYLSFSFISAEVLISWPFAKDKSLGISRKFSTILSFPSVSLSSAFRSHFRQTLDTLGLQVS